jgi:hypothetical protein
LPAFAVLVAAFFCAATARANAAAEASVTPYRPTVSNPAELPAPGAPEFEAGVARFRNPDGSRAVSTPYLIKAAVNEDFGIMVGGDAFLRQTDATGEVLKGRGDTLFLAKHRLAASENQAFGLEWGWKSPTANVGLGSGKTDWIANGIYSVDVGPIRIDANLGFTRVGAYGPNEGRWQKSWGLAFSGEVADKLTLGIEPSGSWRRGVATNAQWLASLSYAITPQLVVDGGFTIGASRQAPDQTLFAGLAYRPGWNW